ncbi:DNA replication fork-blocking protein FOB1 [Nakaseomyces bracarensis]|uniref:DNA replication fork-blocking protein FOB1 n=1 Tax=Nakaseomyces bracarensis TaxID=273131 RepID=A0ABR4NWH1_9SACH
MKVSMSQEIESIRKQNNQAIATERQKFDLETFHATKRRPAGTTNMSHIEIELYNKFVMPDFNESYLDYLTGEESTLDIEFLKRGDKDMRRFAEGLAGKLTQETYTLLMEDKLTMESVMKAMNIWPPNAAETKYSNLIKRFYKDNEGNIRDNKVDNNIVMEPDKLYDAVMLAHITNHHLKTAVLFQCLREVYANCTRDYVQRALLYCNKCNPDRKVKPLEKVRHRNINEDLLPLERIHIEVFAPFEEENDGNEPGKEVKIEGKFSHVFYCRDFRTRYVWCFPLKNMKYKTLVQIIATFFMTVLNEPPIFVESSTIDQEDLKEIFEKLAEKYGLKLGIGFANYTKFHAQGIKRFKTHLHRSKSECIDDWLMCLKQGVYQANRVFEKQLGKQSNVLLSELCGQYERDIRKKKTKFIEQSFAENIKTFPKSGGCVYSEDITDYQKIMERIGYLGGNRSKKSKEFPELEEEDEEELQETVNGESSQSPKRKRSQKKSTTNANSEINDNQEDPIAKRRPRRSTKSKS